MFNRKGIARIGDEIHGLALAVIHLADTLNENDETESVAAILTARLKAKRLELTAAINAAED